MKPSRLAAWMFGAAVCGAWLASAAGVTRQPRVWRVPPRTSNDVKLDALAADVQAQTGRLRERLAAAPSPEGLDRNPFTFSPRSQPAARPVRSAPVVTVSAPAPVPEIVEPVLELIGVAETKKEGGVVRTAMITSGFELMMVVAGQSVLGRYDVVAVGADAVELKDIETGAVRRLVLR